MKFSFFSYRCKCHPGLGTVRIEW